MSEQDAKILHFPDRGTPQVATDDEANRTVLPQTRDISVLRNDRRHFQALNAVERDPAERRNFTVGRLRNHLEGISVPEDAHLQEDDGAIQLYEERTAHRLSTDQSVETSITWQRVRREDVDGEQPVRGMILIRRENGASPNELSLRLEQVGEDYEFILSYSDGKEDLEPIHVTTALGSPMNFFGTDYIVVFERMAGFCKNPDSPESNVDLWQRYKRKLSHPKLEEGK